MFMYNNLLDTATLTESSEASGFPAENVQHPFRTKVWTTEGATPGTANLVIDHGSAKAVNCIVLANYDWASAPGTLDIEFNATDSWEGPDHTESLTWSANPTAYGNKAVIIKKFDTQTYQYNRLNVVYATGDWSLGRIFLGSYFEPTKNYQHKWGQNLLDDSATAQTIGGQDHTDEREKYRTLQIETLVKTQAQWRLYQTMINNAGQNKEMFVAFDYDNEPNEMTMYGKFIKLPGMSSPFRNQFKFGLNFKESR